MHFLWLCQSIWREQESWKQKLSWTVFLFDHGGRTGVGASVCVKQCKYLTAKTRKDTAMRSRFDLGVIGSESGCGKSSVTTLLFRAQLCSRLSSYLVTVKSVLAYSRAAFIKCVDTSLNEGCDKWTGGITKTGKNLFSYIFTKLWNTLSVDIRASSLNVLKRQIKTYFFTLAFN